MIRLAGSVRRDENPLLMRALQKLTLVLYWLPVPFVCVCIPRISFGKNGINGYTGEFVCSLVSSMTVVFNLLEMIWLDLCCLSTRIRGIFTSIGVWLQGILFSNKGVRICSILGYGLEGHMSL